MKSNFKILIILFLAISCTEEIKINLDSTYTRLIVYGEITTDTTTHYISLTKSMDYFEPRQPYGISDAIVTLHWNDQSLLLVESNENKGIYQTPPDFYGIQKTLYKLTIENVDIDGDGEYEFYEAECYLKMFNPIDSITYDTKPIISIPGDTAKWINIKLWALDPPTEDFYLLRWSLNDSLMSDSLRKWGFTDDIPFNGDSIHGFPILSLRQSTDSTAWWIYDNDLVSLEVSSISKEYFYFLLHCYEASGIQTPMTSSIPGNVKGNISNGALGFFAAYGTSRASVVFREPEQWKKLKIKKQR